MKGVADAVNPNWVWIRFYCRSTQSVNACLRCPGKVMGQHISKTFGRIIGEVK